MLQPKTDTGPITRHNFFARAQKYIAALPAEDRAALLVYEHGRKTLPEPQQLSRAELELWLHYFDHHLVWRPKVLTMVIRGETKAFTVPSRRPEFFDSSFVP